MGKYVPIGERLKEERERLGLTQTEFAALGGAGRKTQFNYESGERTPDAAYLAAIAEAGADVLYILTGQRNPNLDDPRPAPPKYTPPPDEEWLMDAYRHSSSEVKAVIMGATKAAALAARDSMPASVRRKTS